MPAVFLGTGDPNSGLHTCQARNYLPTEPSPHLPSFLFIGEYYFIIYLFISWWVFALFIFFFLLLKEKLSWSQTVTCAYIIYKHNCKRLRQEPHKFEVSLGYVVGLCLLRESEKKGLQRETAMNMCAHGCASAFESWCLCFSGVYLGRWLGHVIRLYLIFYGAIRLFWKLYFHQQYMRVSLSPYHPNSCHGPCYLSQLSI